MSKLFYKSWTDINFDFSTTKHLSGLPWNSSSNYINVCVGGGDDLSTKFDVLSLINLMLSTVQPLSDTRFCRIVDRKKNLDLIIPFDQNISQNKIIFKVLYAVPYNKHTLLYTY